MNASKTNLVAVLTTAILLTASAALARDTHSNNGGIPPRPKKDNKGNATTVGNTTIGINQGATLISDPGKKKSGPGKTSIGTNLNNINSRSGDKGKEITITHGGNPPRSPKEFKWKNKYWYCDHSHHIVFCDHFVEPTFARYVVLPGDTFALISLKLFNTPHHSLFLASLNGLPINSVLVPGQAILVPAF